jgi:head-tail adaptor
MRIGLYDQQIVVCQRSVATQNSYGEDTTGTPTTVASLWASVVYLAGRELERVSQRWAEARYEIRCAWQPVTIKREHWVEWNGQTLDILDIRGPGTRDGEWVVIAKDHVE